MKYYAGRKEERREGRNEERNEEQSQGTRREREDYLHSYSAVSAGLVRAMFSSFPFPPTVNRSPSSSIFFPA
jgi:hypothetical protein